MVTYGVAVAEARPGGRVGFLLLDEMNLYYADPFGLALTPDGRWAYISSSGVDTVSVLDMERVAEVLQLSEGRIGASDEELERYARHLGMSFEYVAARIPTGRNPKGVVGGPGRSPGVRGQPDVGLDHRDRHREPAGRRRDRPGRTGRDYRAASRRVPFQPGGHQLPTTDGMQHVPSREQRRRPGVRHRCGRGPRRQPGGQPDHARRGVHRTVQVERQEPDPGPPGGTESRAAVLPLARVHRERQGRGGGVHRVDPAAAESDVARRGRAAHAGPASRQGAVRARSQQRRDLHSDRHTAVSPAIRRPTTPIGSCTMLAPAHTSTPKGCSTRHSSATWSRPHRTCTMDDAGRWRRSGPCTTRTTCTAWPTISPSSS